MFQSLTGTEYLQAEIACKHDKAFEKATWDERLAHFQTLKLNEANTFKKASDPIGLRAAASAYVETKRENESGYMISLDACSSGLQILSLLVSCEKSFDLCGGDSTKCVDSYTKIYGEMNLHGALTRKEVKKAIMTSLYGSIATPERTFGNNVDVFYDTMEAMAPGAWELNLGLQELWKQVKGNSYDWVMPDNFHACIETQDKVELPFNFLGEKYAIMKKIDQRPEFHKGLGPNMIHSVDGMIVREMFRRCMFSKDKITNVINGLNSTKTDGKYREIVETLWNNYKITGFLSTRILDFVDEDTMGLVDSLTIAKLVQSLPEKPFELVSVHDCFRCHPNYGNALRLQYNTILADINDSELLTDMCSQVVNKKINTNKVGKIDRNVILNSNYALA